MISWLLGAVISSLKCSCRYACQATQQRFTATHNYRPEIGTGIEMPEAPMCLPFAFRPILLLTTPQFPVQKSRSVSISDTSPVETSYRLDPDRDSSTGFLNVESGHMHIAATPVFFAGLWTQYSCGFSPPEWRTHRTTKLFYLENIHLTDPVATISACRLWYVPGQAAQVLSWSSILDMDHYQYEDSCILSFHFRTSAAYVYHAQ